MMDMETLRIMEMLLMVSAKFTAPDKIASNSTKIECVLHASMAIISIRIMSASESQKIVKLSQTPPAYNVIKAID